MRVINDLWNRKSSRAAREKTIVDKAQRKKRIRGHPRLTEVGPLGLSFAKRICETIGNSRVVSRSLARVTAQRGGGLLGVNAPLCFRAFAVLRAFYFSDDASENAE